MRCLVAGGAGFIGSHLCEYLLNKNHEVICVDNLITGSEDNIADLKDNSDFVFINQNIIESFEVRGEVDQIYHLASPASPVDYYKYPIDTLRVGSIGTENLLDMAKKINARFLLASTSEVYGNPEVNPQ